MAIDTDTKKLALISYHQPWNVPIPISSDGIGADDSKQLIWEYPGLTWASPAAYTVRCYTLPEDPLMEVIC